MSQLKDTGTVYSEQYPRAIPILKCCTASTVLSQILYCDQSTIHTLVTYHSLFRPSQICGVVVKELEKSCLYVI